MRPTQKLTREQALRVYTRQAAWFSFQEDRRGAIAPEFLADLIVLDKDYMTVPEADIRFIRPVMTVVGGKIVFERSGATQSDDGTKRTTLRSRYRPSTIRVGRATRCGVTERSRALI